LLGSALKTARGLIRQAAFASPVFRQRAGLEEVEHRAWPLPEKSWLMGQSWEHLLFAHWPLHPDAVRAIVPSELPLDTFDGAAWLAVTPFIVRGLHFRRAPPIPGLSSFPEINVRTYVVVADQPGVYFLSLDAGSRFAVAGARRRYLLPYFLAEIAARRANSAIEYHSRRTSTEGAPASFEASYGPRGNSYEAPPGTLEHFLTERYCLYTLDDAHRLWRAQIHHPPWSLQSAAAEIRWNTMADPHGIHLQGEPVLHFARRQDVVIWPLEPADDASEERAAV
jgi:uncharacterized protein YqjF (DUF2071 family)